MPACGLFSAILLFSRAPRIPPRVLQLLEASRYLCRIFYSLSSQELPEQFEDSLDAWMAAFRVVLTFEGPALAALSTPGGKEDDARHAAEAAKVGWT